MAMMQCTRQVGSVVSPQRAVRPAPFASSRRSTAVQQKSQRVVLVRAQPEREFARGAGVREDK